MKSIKKNKNILNSENVVFTINMGQSIYNISSMKQNFISAITTINTFSAIDLKSCVQTYEFDSKNNVTDYILESYYYTKKWCYSISLGTYNGIICTISINAGEPKPYVKALLNYGTEQTSNFIARFNDDAFITCSDHGLLNLLQNLLLIN